MRTLTRSVRQQRSEEHTSELQSQFHLVCRLLLEKKKNTASSTRSGLFVMSRSFGKIPMRDVGPHSSSRRPAGPESERAAHSALLDDRRSGVHQALGSPVSFGAISCACVWRCGSSLASTSGWCAGAHGARGGGGRNASRATNTPSSGGSSLFFFNDTATTEIYTLSLHDALPI